MCWNDVSFGEHVGLRFVDMWLTNHCVQEIVVVDPGGEFQTTVCQAWAEFGIGVRIIGSHAGWQQGLVEKDMVA